jgi:hypothetical protein
MIPVAYGRIDFDPPGILHIADISITTPIVSALKNYYNIYNTVELSRSPNGFF